MPAVTWQCMRAPLFLGHNPYLKKIEVTSGNVGERATDTILIRETPLALAGLSEASSATGLDSKGGDADAPGTLKTKPSPGAAPWCFALLP